MIYKVTFISAVIAAIASLHFANDLREAAHQATLSLDVSRQKLAAAQRDEEMSQKSLEQAIDLHGDTTEEEYVELKKQSQELTEKVEDSSTRLENIKNNNKMQERELNTHIATLRYSINFLVKQVAELENAVNIKNISTAAQNESSDASSALGMAGDSTQETSLSAQPASTHINPMSPENINWLIKARMNLYRRENANLAYFEALFNIEEVMLKAPKVLCICPEDKLEKAKEYIESYSPRAEKLIEVGINKEKKSIQMIIARIFKLVKRSNAHDRDINCYAIITYYIDDDGKVGSETFYDKPGTKSRPTLDKGYVPFPYDGEKTVISE